MTDESDELRKARASLEAAEKRTNEIAVESITVAAKLRMAEERVAALEAELAKACDEWEGWLRTACAPLDPSA